MNTWLKDYPLSRQYTMVVFIIAGLLSIIIALLKVSYQAIKAAVANHVKSLRTE